MEMMVEQLKQVSAEIGTTEYDEEDDPYGAANHESDPGDTDDDEEPIVAAEFSAEDVDNIYAEDGEDWSEAAKASWRKAFNVISKAIVRTQVLLGHFHPDGVVESGGVDYSAFLGLNADEEEEELVEEEKEEEQAEAAEEGQEKPGPLILEDSHVSIAESEAQTATASEIPSKESSAAVLGHMEDEPQQPEAAPPEAEASATSVPSLDLPPVIESSRNSSSESETPTNEEHKGTGETPMRTPARTPRSSASRSARLTPRMNPLEDPDFSADVQVLAFRLLEVVVMMAGLPAAAVMVMVVVVVAVTGTVTVTLALLAAVAMMGVMI